MHSPSCLLLASLSASKLAAFHFTNCLPVIPCGITKTAARLLLPAITLIDLFILFFVSFRQVQIWGGFLYFLINNFYMSINKFYICPT